MHSGGVAAGVYRQPTVSQANGSGTVSSPSRRPRKRCVAFFPCDETVGKCISELIGIPFVFGGGENCSIYLLRKFIHISVLKEFSQRWIDIFDT